MAFAATTSAAYAVQEPKGGAMLNTRWICAGLLTLTALVIAPVGRAMEPGNDTAPWKWRASFGDATLYSPPLGGASYINAEAITSTSDVDHIIGTCGTGKVTWVGVQFTHASGDIDIVVYDLSGNVLGSSTGVTNTERVDLSAFNKQAAVMKVYGYNGAVNSYIVQVSCG